MYKWSIISTFGSFSKNLSIDEERLELVLAPKKTHSNRNFYFRQLHLFTQRLRGAPQSWQPKQDPIF